jgi:hypothetical protein
VTNWVSGAGQCYVFGFRYEFFRMKSILIATCFFLGSPGFLFGRELTGTLYSDHSGPSGRGTGILVLATKTGLVALHYQKPVKQRFTKSSCQDVGAIWTVRAEGEELVSASCNGIIDIKVHSAWMAVRSYIQSTAEAAGQTMGYRPDRRGPVRVEMDGIDVDLSGYLNFGASGMCLEMDRRVDSKTIVIRSSGDCYFYPQLGFTVHEGSPNLWHVLGIKTIDSTVR